MKTENFINDLFDLTKTVAIHDLDKAMRLLADSGATGRDRWLQLVRCATIIANHAIQLPIEPAALAGETPQTVRDILAGAFRVVPSKNGFTLQRWSNWESPSPGETGFWTGVLEDCGAPLWPWREYPTVEAAESAILDYGCSIGLPMTLVRGDGAEIATASPGATAFPRLDQPAPLDPAPMFEFTNVVGLVMPAGINVPEHDGAFKIKPTIDGKHWVVWQWHGVSRNWLSWPAMAPGQIGTPGITHHATYWGARAAILADAKTNRPTEKVYIVNPSQADQQRWCERGIEIGVPPLRRFEVEQLAAAYAPPAVEPDDDPVIITGTPADIGAAIAESAAEAIGAFVPPPTPIGTKLPIPIGEDLWRVDEFTSTGWIIVRDELTWDEVGAYLNPTAAPEIDPVIRFEIVPSDTMPGMFNVLKWVGNKSQIIGGNVNERTAQGIITARQNDPESKMVADARSTTPRHAISKARVRISGLIKCIEHRDEDKIVNDAFIIERLKNLLTILTID